MKEIIYISFTCSHHLGVRKKNNEQIRVWEKAGYRTDIIYDLCQYGPIIKLLYRYYILIKFFVFQSKPNSALYIRQTITLPFFGLISKLRRYSYEVNADISKESNTLSYFKRFIYYFLKDKLMVNADKVFFVSRELRNRYRNISKKSYVVPNCIKELHSKKDLPRGNKIVFVGNEDQKWQGVDLLFEMVKKLPMFQFFIIGNVSTRPELVNVGNVKFFGVLTGLEYEKIMSEVDYSIGTLAFYRSGITEGSALKVRDYVGYDLPVIAGYKDSDFSKAPFFMQLNDDDMKANFKQKIINFCEEWRYRSVHDYIDRSCLCEDRELFRIKLIFGEAEL